MKYVCAMATLVLDIVFTPLVQAGVGLTQVGPAGISARITAELGETGPCNVFIGAMLSGHLFLRGAGTTNWSEYTGGPLPVAAEITLSSSPANVVVTNFDISFLHGVDVYVGYGNSLVDLLIPGHLAKIYTVP
jgi:hypothetical protein